MSSQSSQDPVSSVLIANRGEVAVRIHRGAAAVGLGSVAVFVPEEREALHVRLAEEAHPLVGRAPYLDADQLVALARASGCGLLHPGYGFLSESPELARRCADAGVRFVGPAPEVLDLFGDKAAARGFAAEHGVPVLPATPGPTTLAEAQSFLEGLGPGAAVMVKAVAGGGGRGLRVVRDPAEMAMAWERARSEAAGAFGRDEVYVEALMWPARHVEVQVVGDGSGAVSHLGDRDCTVQRRHQKLIEVAPCPGLPELTRTALHGAAVRLASGCGFGGVGTVEFLLDRDDPERFAFLEVNPRLQVEHTVTEEVTGLDLVAIQLRLALGDSLADLGLEQSSVPPARGMAVQCRVTLEDVGPDGTARPATGTVERVELPGGPGVRVDTAGHAGYVSSGRFDPLFAKVITRTPTTSLAQAAEAADRALADVRIEPLPTNVALLRTVLALPAFRSGTMDTGAVDASGAGLTAAASPADRADQADQADRADDPRRQGDAGAPAWVLSAFAGAVVEVRAASGQHVTVGTPLVVLEAMKMEHVIAAEVSGVVDRILVEPGATAGPGDRLLTLVPDAEQVAGVAEETEVDLDAVRPDLAEARDRHRLGSDQARPEAVARRRRTGRRTARENVGDLCDLDTFQEYGALAIAAQRRRRSLEDLLASTPADGIVTGIGQVNGTDPQGAPRRCVVLAYDYTVLAGTQGLLSHRKTDRMLDLAHRQRLPVVLFAEGGGGRPGDTDTTTVSGLDVATFASMARLSGRVPTVGIASGRCFAGNAALLGCCDVIIATEDATIGMGGPAMIEGGGLGRFRPEEVGPMEVQVPNGVVDLLVADEEAAVRTAKRYLSYFQGPVPQWHAPDQRRLRHVVPENRVRVYDVREAVRLLADEGSVLELRGGFGAGVVTALVRLEGRPVGLLANNPAHLGGAIDADAADKAARFLQLCDAHGLPVVSLCDTPGFMVGPEAERAATVRHFSRLFVAGAHLRVPLVGIVLRKAYGLGAQAMVGGGFHEPLATWAWPTGELGGMGLEGAVRLGFRRELDEVADPEERDRLFERLVADHYERGKAVNAAAAFELDDVIDPAETRSRILGALPAPGVRPGKRRGFVDTW